MPGCLCACVPAHLCVRERERVCVRIYIYVYTYVHQQDAEAVSELGVHMYYALKAGDNPNEAERKSIEVHGASANNVTRC